jgi:hypothetical protein
MELEKLIDLVIEHTGIDIRNKRRKMEYVMARCIYFKIAYDDLHIASLHQIGDSLGKDHATVLHSVRTSFYQLEKYFPTLYRKYLTILDLVRGIKSGDRPAERDLVEDRLQQKDNEIESLNRQIQSMTDGSLSSIINILRRVPEEKLELFKVRIEAIAKMI